LTLYFVKIMPFVTHWLDQLFRNLSVWII
jgi:hypothetical protein